MSTRSQIAIKNADGTIQSVYCHSDGYPGHNGALLLEYYNSEESAREIIALGGLSFLDKKLAPTEELAKCRYQHRSAGLVKHSFDTPHEDVTIAYSRDRGESFEADDYENEEKWKASQEDSWADYMYLWKDGQWFVDGKALTEAIIEND